MNKTRIIHRSSITGKFIKGAYAKKHPRTSVRERIPVKKKKK